MSGSKQFRLFFAVLFFTLLGGGFLYSDQGAIHIFTGTGGKNHAPGIFEQNYGNAGEISFDYTPIGADYSRAYLYGTGLEGYFWSETTGWAVFTGGSSIVPRYTGSGVREIWDGSGYIWSQYAGWSSFSGIEYYPDIATLSGWLWSDTTGWTGLHILADNVGLGFIGRVKILGNVGGKNLYNVNLASYDQGSTTNITSATDIINTIRKNTVISLRNTSASVNTNFAPPTKPALQGVYYYQNTGATSPFLRYSDIELSMNTPASPRTLIVVGGDIYIDTGVILPSNTPSHAIIALKNTLGVGGNIYIHGSITKVQSSLITEGSIYSGRRVGGVWDLYNLDKVRATNLPNYQLYIHGSVISRNTIGGAGVSGGSRCPFTESTCSYDQALRYDLNYFRGFQTGAILPLIDIPLHRGYSDTTLDHISLIIDYDSRMLSDPPPGL